MADSKSAVTESNEENNTLCTTATIVVGRPDLLMTDTSFTATSVNAGATLPVANTVLNQGTLNAGAFTVGFRLSANNIYGGSDDIAITTTRSVTSLAIGASSAATTNLLIPTTTPSGNYYICSKADSANTITEINDSNNTLCSTTQVFVPLPDLTTTALSTTTTRVAPAGTLALSNTAKNKGGSSAGAFVIAFHLSTNAVYGDVDDIAFTATRSLTSLGVGASSVVSTTLTIPSTTPLGAYYICAMADSKSAVTESNEENNTLCTTATIIVGRPDLLLTESLKPTVNAPALRIP